jgi:hypothetical protein
MSAIAEALGIVKPVGPLVIPLSPGRVAHLVMPGPVSRTEWEQMLNVLEVMKPALVREREQDAERDTGSGPASPGQQPG